MRKAAVIALIALGMMLGGRALAVQAPRAPSRLEVRIAGAHVPLTNELDSHIDELARALESSPLTLQLGSEEITRTRAEWGFTLDRDSLRSRLLAANDPASLLTRFHQQRTAAPAIEVPIDVHFESGPTLTFLDHARERLFRQARDARIEVRSGRITEEQVGVALDVHRTLDALEAAVAEGRAQARAHIEEITPSRTAQALSAVRLDGLLGFFETRYSLLPEAAERSHNLRIAASRIDGTVLLPGETFDFNAVVGERSEVNGFRPAPQIAAGELVDGVGGGTCQIAGTLHAAAFFAGLPITSRNPHSRPSTYIWMGLDAVVVYPGLNLTFRNDLHFPIAIGMTVEGGIVRAEVRGANSTRKVTFARRLDEILPFEERIEPNASLPIGARVVRQRGVPGFRITRFRTILDTSSHVARRERWTDEYPATPRLVEVGTGPVLPEAVLPKDDEHSEYTTDDVLYAIEGPGVEGLEVQRRAERAARAGWTEAYVIPH